MSEEMRAYVPRCVQRTGEACRDCVECLSALPAGLTCETGCQHFAWCKRMIGRQGSEAYCDWAPSRFSPRLVPISGGEGENQELRDRLARLSTERDAEAFAAATAREHITTLTRERAEWEEIARGHFADLQAARDELEQTHEQLHEIAQQFDKLVASSVIVSVPPAPAPTEAR